ncbi:Syntaxin-7 [Halocaridina rubra]|uniref:Syntaxin-7 n=1 Tax=Halocaridina rubra TaxID=373956 RepID=A0AAN9A8G2_HALRR
MASEYTRLRSDGRNDQPTHSYGTNDPDVGFAPQSSNPDFFQLCDKITTCLFTINNSASSLDRMLKQVGTSTDNQQLRNRITHINSTSGKAVQDATAYFRALQPTVRGDKERRVRSERLQTEFQAAATRFSDIQKKMMNIMRTAPLPKDMVAVEQDAEAAATEEIIRREQMLADKKKEIKDLEFETAMQLEREQSIRQLETDIIDINEVMRDLSAMVTSQGEIIDSIEDNVESAHGHVEEGREQLIKAAAYQNKSRRRLCCCIALLVIVLLIIGIIIAVKYIHK